MRLTTLFSALVSVPLFLLSSGVQGRGGFSASCSHFYIRDNHFLVANCGDGRGGYRDSTLDLNLCIANYNSNLVCARNGGYGGSCSNCGIRTGAYMTCSCRGTPQGSYLVADLDDCVANYGGNLACAA